MDDMKNLMDEILNGADKVLEVSREEKRPELDARILKDAIRMKMMDIQLRAMLMGLITNANKFLEETEDVHDFTRGVIYGQIKTMVDVFEMVDPETAEIIKEALKKDEIGAILFGDDEEEDE